MLPAYKRKDRKVYLELNVEQSDLRIVDDEKFHQAGKIIEKITSLVHKTYTFEEFNDIAAARGWMGEFKPYEF